MSVSKDEIIVTFDAPETLDPGRPHIRNIFALPAKGGVYYDCYETGDIRYWEKIEEMVKFEQVHDYYWLNHRRFPSFSAVWRRLCSPPALPCKKGDFALSRSGAVFKISQVREREQQYIHIHHRDRIRVLRGHEVDRQHLQKYGTLRTVGHMKNLASEDLRCIPGGSRLVFHVLRAYRFGASRKEFEISCQKKLRAITNPFKPPRPINKFWTLSERIHEEYIEPVLSEAAFPFEATRRKFEVRMRADTFSTIFGFRLQTTNMEANRTGYLDFIKIKMNFRASVIRFLCVFLIRDDDSGMIEGDDNIPSDSRSYR